MSTEIKYSEPEKCFVRFTAVGRHDFPYFVVHLYEILVITNNCGVENKYFRHSDSKNSYVFCLGNEITAYFGLYIYVLKAVAYAGSYCVCVWGGGGSKTI